MISNLVFSLFCYYYFLYLHYIISNMFFRHNKNYEEQMTTKMPKHTLTSSKYRFTKCNDKKWGVCIIITERKFYTFENSKITFTVNRNLSCN